MNGIRTCLGLLIVLSLIGCGETRHVETELQPNGSLKLRLFHDARLIKEAVVSSERMGAANAVSTIHCNEPGLGPWCVITNHINPDADMIVAWNPQTDTIFCSPGYAWGFISTPEEQAFVTVSHPHFAELPDAVDTIYVNEMELTNLPAYSWTVVKSNVEGLVLRGKTELRDPVNAKLMLCGKWTSAHGKAYTVYYLYYNLQMAVANKNIRGIHKVFFVRDGTVAKFCTCDDEIKVVGNRLFEKTDGRLVSWQLSERLTEGL